MSSYPKFDHYNSHEFIHHSYLYDKEINLIHSAYAAAILIGLIHSTVVLSASIDIIDHGDYTRDRLSGLDWLDVTKTVNKSYDYVSIQFGIGGEYEGWRYATGNELNKLIEDYSGTNPSTLLYYQYSEQNNISTMDGLVNLLGSTLDTYYINTYNSTFDAYYGYAEGAYADYTQGYIADGFTGYARSAFLYDDDRDSTYYDYSVIYDATRLSSIAAETLGSFLVRETTPHDIPLPSTPWLISIGLLGLIGFTRKRKIQSAVAA